VSGGPPEKKPKGTSGAECKSTQPFYLPHRQALALSLAAAGLRDAQIGDEMGITLDTVRNHLVKARRRLGARNTTHAVALALTRGLISFP